MVNTGGYRFNKRKLHKGEKRGGSSSRWLERQLNDPYVLMAKDQGMRSRAAFKLIEINEKYKILRPGLKVLDLGAAPGGWSQVAAREVKSIDGGGLVVAADLLDMRPIQGVKFIQGDFLEADIQNKIAESLAGKADVIISDMAPNTTGHRDVDHLRSLALVEEAIYFAEHFLTAGGVMLCKLFNGGQAADIRRAAQHNFQKIQVIKPASSRSESKEVYLLFT